MRKASSFLVKSLCCCLVYLQVSRDELQQQEICASQGQEEQPRPTGGLKTQVERRLRGCLRGPQVDVAVSIEGNFSYRHREMLLCV